MKNRGRLRTNKITSFYKNYGKSVYKDAYTQGRAPSPPPSRPSQNFTRTQNIRAAAQPLQEAKRKYARAPSPTRNGARQRVINIHRTMKNIDRYNNLTGKTNTSKNLESKNNESRSWWERFMVFGGTKHKRTHKKRNRTKRTKRN
jgi:hypothetical protein